MFEEELSASQGGRVRARCATTAQPSDWLAPRHARSLLYIALSLSLITSEVRAQAALPEGLPMIRPGEERLPEIEPEAPAEPSIDLPPVKPPPPEAPISVGPTFVLREVNIEGNTVISDEALQAVIDKYLNQPVSTTQLQELRRELTMVYVDAGYINSGAVLPDQQVANGIVQMRIVEGELSSIDVEGNKNVSATYFSDRIELSDGPPLNVNELQERLQIMLEDPRVERINSTLEPGDRPGESKLAVDVTEGPLATGQFTMDNNRSPSVGELQAGLHLQFQNFTPLAERFLIDWWQTEGLTDIGARLEIPVSPQDTMVFLRVQGSKADVIEGAGAQLDISSESQDFEFGISHPFYREVGKTFSASISLNPRNSETFLLGRPFSFTAGVQDGVSRVTPLRIGLNWLDRDRLQVVAARSVFSFGLPINNATQNPGSIPDGSYFAFLGQGQWIRRWTDGGINSVLRADVQLTPDSLLPLEKFTVGGPLSVRGYITNQMVRDSGYAASAELRIPIFKLPVPGISKGFTDGTVEFAPFFDLGGGWESEGPSFDPKFISSVGAGLRWNVSRTVYGNAYYAEALNNVPDDGINSLQADGISFQIVIGLF